MNCDFYQDADGEIWFFHASDILLRPMIKSLHELKQEENILKKIRLKQKVIKECKRCKDSESDESFDLKQQL